MEPQLMGGTTEFTKQLVIQHYKEKILSLDPSVDFNQVSVECWFNSNRNAFTYTAYWLDTTGTRRFHEEMNDRQIKELYDKQNH